MANEQTTWTKQELSHTLAAVEILKSYFEDDLAALAATTNRLIGEMGADAVLGGFNNVCALLTQQISVLTKHDSLQVIHDVEGQIGKITIVE